MNQDKRKLHRFAAYCYPKNEQVIKAFGVDYDIALGSATETLILGLAKLHTPEEIRAVIAAGVEEKKKNKEPDGRKERSELMRGLSTLTVVELAALTALRANSK